MQKKKWAMDMVDRVAALKQTASKMESSKEELGGAELGVGAECTMDGVREVREGADGRPQGDQLQSRLLLGLSFSYVFGFFVAPMDSFTFPFQRAVGFY